MIFKPAARYPADPRAVFILVLSIFSGLTILALSAAPDSLEGLLPRWGVVLWGALLCTGAATTLVGMAFQGVGGVVTEQVGSAMVGSTALFYSALALWTLDPSGRLFYDAGAIAFWGLACFWRWGQLQALIQQAYRKQVEHEALEQLRDDVRKGFGE